MNANRKTVPCETCRRDALVEIVRRRNAERFQQSGSLVVSRNGADFISLSTKELLMNIGKRWVCVISALGIIAMGSTAMASEGEAQQILACVNPQGSVRIVQAGSACRPSESPLTLAVQSSNGESTPVVVDSADHVVGPILSASADWTTVGLRIGPGMFGLVLSRDSIFTQTSASLWYTTTDCSGTPYFSVGAVVPPIVGPFFGKDYFPGEVQHLTTASERGISGGTSTEYGPCTQRVDDNSVAVMTEIDLSGFVPPFRVR